MKDVRALPVPTPDTRSFWEGAARKELLIQRCDDCEKAYFPPRHFCPRCGGSKVTTLKASGKAKLYSYVITQRPAPGFVGPYAIAVVELEEGPRMMTNIVDCPQTPEELILDMPLRVVFEKHTDTISLPLFRPDR
jgi:uncharacterized OB-fold protein